MFSFFSRKYNEKVHREALGAAALEIAAFDKMRMNAAAERDRRNEEMRRETAKKVYDAKLSALESKIDAIAQHLGIELAQAKCECKTTGYVAKEKEAKAEEWRAWRDGAMGAMRMGVDPASGPDETRTYTFRVTPTYEHLEIKRRIVGRTFSVDDAKDIIADILMQTNGDTGLRMEKYIPPKNTPPHEAGMKQINAETVAALIDVLKSIDMTNEIPRSAQSQIKTYITELENAEVVPPRTDPGKPKP